MLTSKFKYRLRQLAEEHGLNPADYSDMKLARRERDFISDGGTDEELHEILLKEVLGIDANKGLDSFGKSICPNCGKNTLIHEGGCEVCRECSYSRCG